MNRLYFDSTRKTPTVILDPSGSLRIEGRSIPEDAKTFYKEVIEWIDEYLKEPAGFTTLDVAFEYLNSGTSKKVFEILTSLKELEQNGHNLSVKWYYEEGDDDILERGEYFASILDLKINFIETE